MIAFYLVEDAAGALLIEGTLYTEKGSFISQGRTIDQVVSKFPKRVKEPLKEALTDISDLKKSALEETVALHAEATKALRKMGAKYLPNAWTGQNFAVEKYSAVKDPYTVRVKVLGEWFDLKDAKNLTEALSILRAFEKETRSFRFN